jgi:hypothetical protein
VSKVQFLSGLPNKKILKERNEMIKLEKRIIAKIKLDLELNPYEKSYINSILGMTICEFKLKLGDKNYD